MRKNDAIPYEYHNLPIPGGGYVTGFAFHPVKKNILYCRTDIGGTYRYDYEAETWISLIDHVTMKELEETYPIAIALDPKRPDRLLIASGLGKKAQQGVLSVSDDRGGSFQKKTIPAAVHGNFNGRGTGMRLIVSGESGNMLYFASQKDGLLISFDLGTTWIRRDVCGEKYLTFVWMDPRERMLVVGSAGVTNSDGVRRGHSLYISYDKGVHFEPLMQPGEHDLPTSKFPGLVAQRCDYDGKYLYVTFAQTGEYAYVKELGYSCDGGDVIGARVVRYSFAENGKALSCEEITPNACNTVMPRRSDPRLEDEILYPEKDGAPDRRNPQYRFGFSGISSCAAKPGLLVMTTICRRNGDKVYLSLDYGENWQIVLHDLEIGNMQFHTPYMKKEYNGGYSLIHWLSDIKINPHDPEEAWFNTGTGVFRTCNLLGADRSFSDCCAGIEETVHLNVYSPTGGAVQCIDIVGDLGGFAFENVDKPCENSFADMEGNRYITCINADFSDEKPACVIVTARGNWTGKTKGGLILSTDQCKSFRRLIMPFGISDYLDEKLRQIERPNVNAGWVAMSPDCSRIVWSVADGITLPIEGVICSGDGGKHFSKARVYDPDGSEVTQGKLKVFSDRTDSDYFYGFGENSALYVSGDGGQTFFRRLPDGRFPEEEFGLIDTANPTEIRGETGKSGVFYIAMNRNGLWKYEYDKEKDTISVRRLSQEGDSVYRMGLGLHHPGSNYMTDEKAVYFCGELDGEYGFYRSFDDLETVERINTDAQMYGEINSIDGDCRTFGRFFIGTGSRGVLCGVPAKK